MKTYKLFLALISVLILISSFSFADAVKGKVTSVHGDFIEIDIGSLSGITVGDTGRAYYTVKIGPDEKTVYLAKFKVVSLKESACRARIEESTAEVKVGHLIEIDVKLSNTGELEVKSDPSGAKIYLDGKDMGVTPLTLSRIRPKRYLIRVIKEGYDPYEVNVEIAGTERKTILAYLEQAKKEGRLVIRTEPTGATVYIDGRSVGTSPYEGKGISPGVYKVRIVKEGYEAWERDVPADAGKTVEILARLKEGPPGPKPGELFRDPTTGMEFVFVKGGCFEMGDTFGDGDSDEKPVHEVCVGDFYMGKFEVTQSQWEKVIGSNPSHFKSGADYSVEMVSWSDVQDFIRRLNQMTGKKFRLPTEAQWEYAARSGGKKEKWAGASSEYELMNYAWYSSNSGRKTQPVGQRRPNGLGLYDMSGNVWEWCQDWYDANYYRNIPRNNPEGPSTGNLKVLRGGSWYSGPWSIRTSDRYWLVPTNRSNNIGFRLVLSSE